MHRFLPVIILFLLVALLSPGALAQGLNDNSYSYPQPYNINGTNNVTTTLTEQGRGTNILFRLDWRWVLPIMLMGIGLLFFRGSRERLGRRHYAPILGYDVAYHQLEREKRHKKTTSRRRFKKTNLKAA